jgi:predicted ATP-grasp superfamily ATP-dependent carboligase
VIGFNHLFAHDACAGDFRYGGAISGARPDESEQHSMEETARRLTAALGLRGVNGLDFVLARGRALLLELNARPPATLELYERALPGGGLRTHLDACRGELPSVPCTELRHGHGVLYAQDDLVAPELDWPDWCSDRPTAGNRVPAGMPLCSVSAVGFDTRRVEQVLRHRSAGIRFLLQAGAAEVA